MYIRKRKEYLAKKRVDYYVYSGKKKVVKKH